MSKKLILSIFIIVVLVLISLYFQSKKTKPSVCEDLVQTKYLRLSNINIGFPLAKEANGETELYHYEVEGARVALEIKDDPDAGPEVISCKEVGQ